MVVVCPEQRWELLDGPDFSKPVLRTDGGAERQDSVMNGLAALGPGVRFVAVHDGARPLVSRQPTSTPVWPRRFTHRAATLARRAIETMKRSDEEGFCMESREPRQSLVHGNPAGFRDRDLLREAYQNVAARGLAVTDEVSAVQQTGVKVKFIESMHPNLKITTPADLALAEALMAQAS